MLKVKVLELSGTSVFIRGLGDFINYVINTKVHFGVFVAISEGLWILVTYIKLCGARKLSSTV